MDMAKRLAALLPEHVQTRLKLRRYGRQIKLGTFDGGEPEFDQLEKWVKKGDWVLDIGANIGHYSYKLSRLVGEDGRVIAFEPVPQTFHLLTNNVAAFQHRNVTVMNCAASDAVTFVRMAIPTLHSGLENLYMAKISQGSAVQGSEVVGALAIPVDALNIPGRVSLIKIDVEGHEMSAITGMEALIKRDGPVLIVEGREAAIEEKLRLAGYEASDFPGSPNRVFTRAAG